MDSRDQLIEKPLLEETSLQENTIEHTGDGSVCIRGHPASKKCTGKWEACSLTIVCLFCSYLAFSSIGKNLVSYLTQVLHETNVAAARDVSTWHGTSYIAPLVGAFIADSYLGKFFDKAAIVTSADVESVTLLNKWRTCTVTQVEEFKILVRIIPIGTPMILFHTVLDQMFSTFVEQAVVMDKHIGYFEIPPASFQCVDVIAVLALVPVYERILVPVFRKFTGMENGITPLQRMGIGLVCPVLSMVSAALVESNRLQIAQAKGLVHRKVAVPMSILWQGPQYFLMGAGEVFSNIALSEFFYGESPDAMRSLCLALSYAVISAGKYLNSFILSLVPVFTATEGSPGWIPDNLNEGHLDRFFATRYKCRKAS